MPSQYAPIEDPRHYVWKYGIPAELWITNLDVVREFVDRNQLRAITPEHFVADDPIPVGVLAKDLKQGLTVIYPPRPFPGGMRMPHLHFEGALYPLEPEQWAEFSQVMLDRFQSKLETAKNVSFDQLMEVSRAVEAL